MSFTTRHHALFIATGDLAAAPSVLPNGQANSGGVCWRKLDEEASISEEGWDSLKIFYAIRKANFSAEECAAYFPQGAQLGGRKWWITGSRPVRVGPGIYRAEVDLKGWAIAKPAKIRVGTSAEQQSGTNMRAPTAVGDTVGAIFAKLETHENMPTIAVTYLVDNYLSPTTQKISKVGTAQTPPVTIDVADTVWEFLTEYVWHWPQGWVLMGSEPEPLAGCAAAMVTDTYKYIRAKTPG